MNEIIKNYLDCNGKVKVFPSKRKMKDYVMLYLSTKFESGRKYTESEVNDLLDEWHVFHDPATLRREMYNNKFIDREVTGRTYWLQEDRPTLEDIDKKYGK